MGKTASMLSLTMLLTQQIFDATVKYLTTLTEERTWGGGDSLDRERVGYILENEMSVKLY